MSKIQSILELEVKGVEAVESAAKHIHDFNTGLEYATFNQSRYNEAAKNFTAPTYGSDWSSSHMVPRSASGGATGWTSYGGGGRGRGAPPGGSGGGSSGGSGGSGGFDDPEDEWPLYPTYGRGRNRRRPGVKSKADLLVYGKGRKIPPFGDPILEGIGSVASGAGHIIGGVASGVGSAVGGVAEGGMWLLNKAVTNTSTAFKKLSDITTKMVSPGSFFGNMANMMSFSGLIGTASTLNNRAFFSNAVGTNPNDIMRLRATYGQLGDVGGQLSSLARERAAPYSLAFATSGISQQRAREMTTEELLSKMTDVARRFAKDPNWGANEMTLKATGLGDIFNVDDMLRLKNITDEEYESIKKFNHEMEQSTKLLNRESWQRFNRERQVGMASIETLLQNKLEPLLKPVSNAVTSVVNALKGAGAEGTLEKAVAEAGHLIDQFSDSLDTGNWKPFFDLLQEDAVAVGKIIKDGAKATWDFVHKWALDVFPEATKDFDNFMINAGAFFDDLWQMRPTMKELKDVVHDVHEAFKGFETWLKSTFGITLAETPVTDPVTGKVGGEGREHRFDELINKAALSQGIDPRDMWSLVKAESSFDPDALSEKGAFGLGQMMPGTFRRYAKKGDKISDPEANLNAMAAYLRNIMDEVGGDMDLAVAAYNTGEHNKYIKAGQIPPYEETQKHVAKFRKFRQELDSAMAPGIVEEGADAARESLRAKAEERRKVHEEDAKELREWYQDRQKKRAEGTLDKTSMVGPNFVRPLPRDAAIRLSINSNTSNDVTINTMRMAGALWG